MSSKAASTIVAAGLAVVLTLVVAGCGQSGPQPTSIDDGAPAQQSAQSTSGPASAASELSIQGNDEFHVKAAWIRAAPPGAGMLAGYLELRNAGSRTRRLVGARSDAFADVSIHQSYVENGVSGMRPAGPLDLQPGERLRFEPGGLHLMLMSPKVDTGVGQRIPLWLCFEDGDQIEEIEVQLEVRPASAD